MVEKAAEYLAARPGCPEYASSMLTNLALRCGSGDNITVIVVLL